MEVELTEMTDEEKRRIGIGVPQQDKGAAEDLNEIHRVIAVMSGKGGVGKSLVSGLLAVALRRAGLPGWHPGRRHHRARASPRCSSPTGRGWA